MSDRTWEMMLKRCESERDALQDEKNVWMSEAKAQAKTADRIKAQLDALQAKVSEAELENARLNDKLLKFPEGMTLETAIREIHRCYADDPYAEWMSEKIADRAIRNWDTSTEGEE